MYILNDTIKYNLKIFFIFALILSSIMCVPPSDSLESDNNEKEQAYWDSVRAVMCPRKMSSAAEYYKNRDWESTVRIYGDIVKYRCDQDDPEEVYQYYAIAFEYLGKFDSSEYVLLKGLQLLPDNINLRKRLAYSYKKQGKLDQEIMEYSRLSDLIPDDITVKTELAKLYGEQDLYDDQIDILRQILDLDPNNENAQGDIARVYELTGRDPLQIYGERFRNNPDNVSYGLDFAERLLNADRSEDAIDVLKQVIRQDKTSKVAYRKLGLAYDRADRYDEASSAYEELHALDIRDFKVAIQVSDVNIAAGNYGKAMRWAEKAITSSKSGEAYGQRGNVYYKAFQECRTADISDDDRIIASLAHQSFVKADENDYRRFHNSMLWLEENEVLFGRTHWFMLDPKMQKLGYVKPDTECYNWVEKKLDKDPNW
jgi:tetratricopeptide (TPR) repeat protein